MTPYLLLLVALFLIAMEFFLPGAIMGSIGAILFVASIVVFAVQTQTVLGTILFTVVGVVLLVGVVRFCLSRFKRAAPESGLYSEKAQEHFHAAEYDPSLVGKEGRALSDLKPAGHVLVGDKRCQALSESGYIDKGADVVVIGGRGACVIVKQKSEV